MKLTITKKILSSLLILSIICGVMVNGSVKADAPFTTINIIGSQGLNGIYYGNDKVELIAVASEGVSSTQYKLKKDGER
ncbi:hypothetical protein [Paenibacillus harenae]|uniref:Uncharacterized protein n=1 Tax=Paenibacillus harenae TaxID=306543 RepID=A0ABT9TTK5_PAEHA|nr:hypothetical protein [Paenibacillus harenae]MDQ0110673.1 hypothetical protein [Paenibacillus harenae]